jgi:hypothetical protein
MSATGGYPAAIEAMLADQQRRGGIRRRLRRWEFDPLAVASMDAAVEKLDLSSFPPALVRTVQAASLIGIEFDGTTVATLLEEDELEVEDRLAAAVHLNLLVGLGEETLPSGDILSRFRFAEPHMLRAFRQSLPEEERSPLEAKLLRVRAPAL